MIFIILALVWYFAGIMTTIVAEDYANNRTKLMVLQLFSLSLLFVAGVSLLTVLM